MELKVLLRIAAVLLFVTGCSSARSRNESGAEDNLIVGFQVLRRAQSAELLSASDVGLRFDARGLPTIVGTEWRDVSVTEFSNALPSHLPAMILRADNGSMVVLGESAETQKCIVFSREGAGEWIDRHVVIEAAMSGTIYCLQSNAKESVVHSGLQLVLEGVPPVRAGQSTRIQIPVVNCSWQGVEITASSFSCGCVSGAVDTSSLEPWGATVLDVTVAPSESQTSPLRVDWILGLKTLRGEERRAMPVEVQIADSVSIAPRKVAIGAVAQSDSDYSFSVRAQLPRADAICAVSPVHLDEGLSWMGVTRNGKDVLVEFGASPFELPRLNGTRFVSGTAVIAFDLGGRTVLHEITVDALLEEAVYCLPRQIDLGRIGNGKSASKTVEVISKSGDPVVVYNIASGVVDAKVIGKRIEIIVRPDQAVGPFSTAVYVLQGTRGFTIPIVGTVVANPSGT